MGFSAAGYNSTGTYTLKQRVFEYAEDSPDARHQYQHQYPRNHYGTPFGAFCLIVSVEDPGINQFPQNHQKYQTKNERNNLIDNSEQKRYKSCKGGRSDHKNTLERQYDVLDNDTNR